MNSTVKLFVIVNLALVVVAVFVAAPTTIDASDIDLAAAATLPSPSFSGIHEDMNIAAYAFTVVMLSAASIVSLQIFWFLFQNRVWGTDEDGERLDFPIYTA